MAPPAGECPRATLQSTHRPTNARGRTMWRRAGWSTRSRGTTERKKERPTPVSRRALRGHSVNEDHRGARDDCIPLSRLAKYVSPRTRAPVGGVLYMLALTLMLATPMCYNKYVVSGWVDG
jgi:hypothetical protein